MVKIFIKSIMMKSGLNMINITMVKLGFNLIQQLWWNQEKISFCNHGEIRDKLDLTNHDEISNENGPWWN